MNFFRAQIFGGDKAAPANPLVSEKRRGGADADAGLGSVAVPRGEVRKSNSRDDDRHRLTHHEVTVSHKGSQHLVQLINVSGGGAMVSAAFAPLLWDRVDLHLGAGQVVECAVRWIKDDRIGLEFAHETRIDCDLGEQSEVLREVMRRCFPDVEPEHDGAPATVPAEASDELVESRRTYQRHPLIWNGTIHYNHASSGVRLRNISARGALVETSGSFPEGAELLLDLGDAGSLFGTVSWTVGDQVGLTFQTPFDITQLGKARPEVAPAKWEQPEYLRQGHAESPWAAQWARMSVGELKSELEGFAKR